MKVKELLVKLVPNSPNLIPNNGGESIQGYEYEFYFDGLLVENVNSITFDEKITKSEPAVVRLEFEVEKITFMNSDTVSEDFKNNIN